ncbi:M23 family metallopeptidase [Microbacterium sp. HJ5]
MAEPAPTRRSSRTSTTPVQASSETLGASRAELRRKAAGATPERPAVVWGRPVEEKQKDAAPAGHPVTHVIPVEAETLAHPQPLTDLPAAPVAAAPVVAPPEPTAAPAPVTAPLSRRARRAPRTEEQPAVAVPPIAESAPVEAERPAPAFRAELPTAAAPAPMLDAVLAPAEPFELLEPVVESAGAAETVEPEGAASVDDFEAAARLFSFTGELPVQAAAAEAPEEPAADAAGEARPHVATRKLRAGRGAAFKRMTTASFSVGVMGIVGLMAVGMTTPAEAVAAASGVDASMSIIAPGDSTVTEIDADEIQAYVAPATVEAAALDRNEGYDTTTIAELASQAGIRNFSNLFINDPNAAIQWPFAVGVTMSYGFGMRSGRMHEGVDFTPGAGAPIQAIADGTVRVASEAGGAYGVHVIIDHMIDGQLVSSHYAHMQYGSLQVSPGQKVTVGTMLGRTGNTGRSYGAHTHFEILLNGTTAIDPLPWLREHTGG